MAISGCALCPFKNKGGRPLLFWRPAGWAITGCARDWCSGQLQTSRLCGADEHLFVKRVGRLGVCGAEECQSWAKPVPLNPYPKPCRSVNMKEIIVRGSDDCFAVARGFVSHVLPPC